MIEDWGDTIDYAKYYIQCAPKLCSYKIASRSPLSYIISVVLGLCGGVIAALKIIIPFLVRMLRDRCRPAIETNLPTGNFDLLLMLRLNMIGCL